MTYRTPTRRLAAAAAALTLALALSACSGTSDDSGSAQSPSAASSTTVPAAEATESAAPTIDPADVVMRKIIVDEAVSGDTLTGTVTAVAAEDGEWVKLAEADQEEVTFRLLWIDVPDDCSLMNEAGVDYWETFMSLGSEYTFANYPTASGGYGDATDDAGNPVYRITAGQGDGVDNYVIAFLEKGYADYWAPADAAAYEGEGEYAPAAMVASAQERGAGMWDEANCPAS